MQRESPGGWDELFDPQAYEVLDFDRSSAQTTRTVASQLGEPLQDPTSHRQTPFINLRTVHPQIYADRKVEPTWITFDVEAHGAEIYRQHAAYSRATPWVLLWRRADAPTKAQAAAEKERQQAHDRRVSNALSGESLGAHLERLRGLTIDGPSRRTYGVDEVGFGLTLHTSHGTTVDVPLGLVEEIVAASRDGFEPDPDDNMALAATALAATLPGMLWENDGALTLTEPPDDDGRLTGGSDLDRLVMTRVRVEQTSARRLLFGQAGLGKCSLCSARLPVELLVAAHIKRRSDATRAERLDLPNIVMPACLLGCDALYERGWICVGESGEIQPSDEAMSPSWPAAVNHAQRLLGVQCTAWTTKSAAYFRWHRLSISHCRQRSSAFTDCRLVSAARRDGIAFT
jgi:hypothetical protein